MIKVDANQLFPPLRYAPYHGFESLTELELPDS